MNKQDESISLVIAPVYDLMFHHLATSVTLLHVAKQNISLCEQMSSRCISDATKDYSQKPPRSLLHSRKSLRVILSEIDKLIKRVEEECDDFLDNSSLDDDDSVISGN
ncbi:hypothetical protein MICAER10613_034710 [Microcystis aeruginosa]